MVMWRRKLIDCHACFLGLSTQIKWMSSQSRRIFYRPYWTGIVRRYAEKLAVLNYFWALSHVRLDLQQHADVWGLNWCSVQTQLLFFHYGSRFGVLTWSWGNESLCGVSVAIVSIQYRYKKLESCLGGGWWGRGTSQEVLLMQRIGGLVWFSHCSGDTMDVNFIFGSVKLAVASHMSPFWPTRKLLYWGWIIGAPAYNWALQLKASASKPSSFSLSSSIQVCINCKLALAFPMLLPSFSAFVKL